MARRNVLIVPVILWSIIGLLIIALISSKVYKWPDADASLVDQNGYQAVFLDNNQIYFGHLKNVYSQYPVLKDVYYIEVSETTSEKKSQTINKLVKLGETEPHKPKSEMILNSRHLLFWENMRPDSQVVRAIESRNLQNK